MQIHVLADTPLKVQKIRLMLEPRHRVSGAVLGFPAAVGLTASSVIVDADLRNIDNIASIRAELPKLHNAAQRLFIVDTAQRAAVVQAYSLGASSVIPSPLDAR